MTSTGTHPPISTTPFTVNGITYTPPAAPVDVSPHFAFLGLPLEILAQNLNPNPE